MIARATWNPAREIEREELGHLAVGAPADVAVLRLEKGELRLRRLVRSAALGHASGSSCELTLRDGKVVYDLNGLTRPDWETLPRDYRSTGDPRWDGIGR